MTHACCRVSNHQQLNCIFNSLFIALPKIWLKFHWSFFLTVQIYNCTWDPITWWHHHMEMLSALPAHCEGNPPYHGSFMTVICWQMVSGGSLNGFCISCCVKYHQYPFKVTISPDLDLPNHKWFNGTNFILEISRYCTLSKFYWFGILIPMCCIYRIIYNL